MTDAIEGRDLAYTPPDAALGPLAQANRIGITPRTRRRLSPWRSARCSGRA